MKRRNPTNSQNVTLLFPKSKDIYDLHVEIHNESRCPICNISFMQIASLKKHVKVEHNGETLPLSHLRCE